MQCTAAAAPLSKAADSAELTLVLWTNEADWHWACSCLARSLRDICSSQLASRQRLLLLPSSYCSFQWCAGSIKQSRPPTHSLSQTYGSILVYQWAKGRTFLDEVSTVRASRVIEVVPSPVFQAFTWLGISTYVTYVYLALHIVGNRWWPGKINA